MAFRKIAIQRQKSVSKNIRDEKKDLLNTELISGWWRSFRFEINALLFLVFAVISVLPSQTLASQTFATQNYGYENQNNGNFEGNGPAANSRKNFCIFATQTLTQTSAKLSRDKSVYSINKFLKDLKLEKVVDDISIIDSLVLPSVSLFESWNIRKGRTFLIHAWDLNRLLEMQTRIDLIVIGNIDTQKIELVKNALKETGIRIFPLRIDSSPNGMEVLAAASDGSIIELPSRCN